MWQNKRSYDQEIIDKGPDHYSSQEYYHCLKLLDRINWFLGGFRASKKAFYDLNCTLNSILEVGCGSGYLCQLLQRWNPQACIEGIDINTAAIAYAKEVCPQNLQKSITFRLQSNTHLEYLDGSFDVVTAMLVCHHMTDEELILFLKECYRICSKAVIFNDLHRHLLAYISFSLIAPFAFSNRLIWNDGRLSIKRSFRKNDWIFLLKKAGFKKDQYILKWHWMFRWTLTLKKL